MPMDELEAGDRRKYAEGYALGIRAQFSRDTGKTIDALSRTTWGWYRYYAFYDGFRGQPASFKKADASIKFFESWRNADEC